MESRALGSCSTSKSWKLNSHVKRLPVPRSGRLLLVSGEGETDLDEVEGVDVGLEAAPKEMVDGASDSEAVMACGWR